jgi:Cu+-exporting ATPase
MTDKLSDSVGVGDCCSGLKVGDAAITVKDPVCGMTVDPVKSPHHAEHAGHSYHFCSAGCRSKFIAAPDDYLGDKPKLATTILG